MKRTVTYREKSRIFSNNKAIEIFFDLEDVSKIKEEVFIHALLVEDKELQRMLNDIIKFLTMFFPYVLSHIPGKTDELDLLGGMIKYNDTLQNDLSILLNKYAGETFRHLIVDGQSEQESINFLRDLQTRLLTFDRMLKNGLNTIKAGKGKKTGNSSKIPIYALVQYLVDTYELITKKNPSDNFQRGTRVSRECKGECYIFVKVVFEKIDKKYSEYYGKNDNPFKILLDRKSLALSKHIERALLQRTSKRQ